MGTFMGTRNFGIRRGFHYLVREGRLRAPATGTFILGSGVEQNLTTPGEIQEITNNAIGAVGADTARANLGILWYEHDAQEMEGQAAFGTFPMDYNTAANGRLVQVLSGKGVKVWFRNTDADTTEPGLNYSNTRPAVTMVSELGSTLAVGDLLGWDDTAHAWAVTTTAAEAVMVVTSVDNTAGVCEAELLV